MEIQNSSRSPSQLGKLILVRLLAAGKPHVKSDVDSALRRYFVEHQAMPAAEWRDLLDKTLHDLHAEELILAKPLQLTDKGRTCALQVLSIDSLPAGVNWLTLRNRYLIAIALDIQPESKAEWERLGTADGLRAAVLAKHHQLPLGPVPTAARALHALAWLQLRQAHNVETPWEKDFSRNAVLGVTLLNGRPGKNPEEGLAARATGAASPHPDKVREALICTWVREGHSAHVANPQLDLPAFAAKVRELARSAPTGRFGEHRVFISHVWNRLQQEAAGAEMTRDAFTKHLVEANREGLLTLSRADLMSSMNPDDVRQSEIQLQHSSFHFIRTDR